MNSIGAIGGSILFHLLVLFLMVSSASGDLVSGASGGGQPGPIMVVSLVTRPSAAAAPSPPDAAGDLQPLFAKFRDASDEPPVPVPTSREPDLKSLIDRLSSTARKTEASPAKALQLPQPASQPLVQTSSTASETGQASKTATPGPTPGSASSGGLWGQIEPCWRGAATARVPVTLEVTLDSFGGLGAAPKIVRRLDAPIDEPRLQAEAHALAALASCIPRGGSRLAAGVYRLEFRPAR